MLLKQAYSARPTTTMASSRPDELKHLYYQTMVRQDHRAHEKAWPRKEMWDTFVLKQNARAAETMMHFKNSPRSNGSSSLLSMSPRSPRMSPRAPRQLQPLTPRELRTTPQPPMLPHAPIGPPMGSPRRLLPHKRLERELSTRRVKRHEAHAKHVAVVEKMEAEKAQAKKTQDDKFDRQKFLMEQKMLALAEHGVNSHFSDMWKVWRRRRAAKRLRARCMQTSSVPVYAQQSLPDRLHVCARIGLQVR